MTIEAHHPAAEAAEKLGPDLIARVLEPSPPAVDDGEFYADDPAVARPDGDDAGVVVTPTSAGDRTWEEIVAERPDLSTWAAARWLAARPALPAVPADYPAGRDGYHRLAFAIVAEARRVVNGKFGLRFTRGGFGTPFFDADRQVRVEHGRLVVQDDETVRDAPITTLRAAAELVGVEPGTAAAEHDSPPLGDLDEDLGATEGIGAFLGTWFGFSWAVLEELRVTPGAVDTERTQLWPGHFDPAVAMGDAEAGGRATYGCSPGDAAHDEPYLYVGAWGDVDRTDAFWNEDNFNGASMTYAALHAAADPLASAIDFFRGGYSRLNPAGR